MTEDKLYELDRDELIKELEKKTGIEIVDGYSSKGAELYIGSQTTADGYEIYTITNGSWRDLNPEYDIFYYEPPAEAILERFAELDEGDVVLIEETEWLSQEEDKIIDYLLENYVEEYDEIHEIIKESGE